MTDGHENASKEWSHPAIKSLIEQQTKVYGWEFLYMGADQDAIEVGSGLGVAPSRSVTYSRGSTRAAMSSTSAVVNRLRSARAGGFETHDVGFSPEERAASSR